jgi:hypothetical protein
MLLSRRLEEPLETSESLHQNVQMLIVIFLKSTAFSPQQSLLANMDDERQRGENALS